MDTAEKCPPGFRPCLLFHPILIFQRRVRCDIYFCVTGRFVIVPGREGQGINVQVVEHIFNGNLAAELLEYKHILPVVAVKGNAPCGPVVCHPVNAPGVMGAVNAPCLSRTAGPVEIGHLQGPILHGVLLRRQGLPQQVNITDTKSHGGIIVNDLRGGQAVPDILDEPEHLRVFLRPFRWSLAPFLKCPRHRGFCLVGIRPSALLADVCPVFLYRSICLFYMSRGKTIFDSGKTHRRWNVEKQVRVICPRGRCFVGHAVIGRGKPL